MKINLFEACKNTIGSRETIHATILLTLKWLIGDFPDGPVVKTMHSQCRGHGFDSGQGIKIPHVLVWP